MDSGVNSDIITLIKSYEVHELPKYNELIAFLSFIRDLVTRIEEEGVIKGLTDLSASGEMRAVELQIVK